MMQLTGDEPHGWTVRLPESADVQLIKLTVRLEIVVGDVAGDRLEVFLDAPFVGHLVPDGPSVTLDPETVDPALGAFAVALKYQQLTECRVGSDGTLSLRFASGAAIDAPPHDTYESWEIVHERSEVSGEYFRLICGSGGDVAVWGDPSDDSAFSGSESG